METKGQLVSIRPLRATLLHNTGLFTQKDPVCEITLGKEVVKTAPCWGMGSRPEWREAFTLLRTTETLITFCILNRSKIGIRHLVASGTFTFLDFPATSFESHIQLLHKDVVAGELQVLITLVGQLQPGMPPGPGFVIVKQQLVDESRNSRGGHRSKRQKRVREVVIVPEAYYPPQPYAS